MNKPFPTKTNYDRSVPRIFASGARAFLHPKLAVLDQIDCIMEYFPENRIIVVSYDPEIKKKDYTDYEEKVYKKTVMGGVDFILEVITKDYINPLRQEIQKNLCAQSETINEEPGDSVQ